MENLTRITVPTGLPSDAEPLPSPHFDDEATLLTARPVVPIKRGITLGNRRDVLLTAAILLTAAFIGAVAALSIDRFQSARQAKANPVSEVSAPAANTAAHSAETPVMSESPALPAASPENAEATTAATTEMNEKSPVRTDVPAKAATRPSKKTSLDRERTVSKRAPNRDEQRENVTRRRAFDSGAERPRYASRIREIFEGPGHF